MFNVYLYHRYGEELIIIILFYNIHNYYFFNYLVIPYHVFFTSWSPSALRKYRVTISFKRAEGHHELAATKQVME